MEVHLDQLNSLVEDRDMLAENLENLVKKEQMESEQRGIVKGEKQGIEGTLRKLITLKFGDLPEWADQRLMDATDEQLDEWVMQILSADSLEALLGER